ncbi:hypothetical protein J4471_03505 [Candidatus Woesearchaeota archaeon]|nr:hypothetical protein [Candidatus Woesearchaeota archaeon]
MKYHRYRFDRTSSKLKPGIYYGIVKYLDANGEGVIQFLSKDKYGLLFPDEVIFFKEELKAKDYYLNNGEKVMFRYTSDRKRNLAVDIIPVALEEIIRKDIHEQIQARLKRLRNL